MARWVKLSDWQRSKGSVSKQLQDKSAPRARLGRVRVKASAAVRYVRNAGGRRHA